MSIIQTKFNGKSIIVQTKKGSNISNTQSGFLTNLDKGSFEDLQKKFPNIIIRGKPNPLCNCHGFTFASKRTAIFESEELWKIIDDDDYEIIEDKKDVLPGDVILYFSDNGDIEHSGIVISKPDPTLGIPQILSKWGKYSEIIHSAYNCPYDKSNIQYYRMT